MALGAWAIHVLTNFGPGEIRRGLEPLGLWPPLVALVGVAGAAGVWSAVRATRAPPEPTEAAPTPPSPRDRALDVAIAVALGLGMYVALGAWIARVNPDGVLLGMDGPSYLRTLIAVATEQWEHYNTDKRILHAWLGARLVAATALSPLAATQLLTHVAVSAFPSLGYALARTLTGRGEALLVAILCVLHPVPWAFAPQSTNYPLYFSVIVAALAALTWALARPTLPRWALAGLLTGLALSTQEKALLSLGPALAVGLPLAWLGDRTVLRPLVGGLLVGTLATAAVVGALDPPVSYTPFGSLVANQREELHRDRPWAWAAVRRPDPALPTNPRLPTFLRDGELEAALSAVTTPADSDVLRLRSGASGATWVPAPNTSIAPLSERLRINLHELEQTLSTLPRVGLLLLLVGLAGALLPGKAGAGRWLLLVPAAALVSAWGPLSLKYNIRYFVHLLPVVALVGVVGWGRLLRLVAGADRGSRALVAVASAAFWLLFGQALWVGSDTAWESPSLPFPSPAARADAAEDPGGNAGATLQVARWLATQPTPTRIVDCAPHPVWLYLHEDARVTPPDGEHACAAALARPLPGTWLVVSSHREYRGPGTPHADALVTSGRWRVVGGWDPRNGALTPQTARWTESAVVVVEAVGP
ncbi:MAG: hypothetical protein V4850_29965 [Myxococcota bacterium]